MRTLAQEENTFSRKRTHSLGRERSLDIYAYSCARPRDVCDVEKYGVCVCVGQIPFYHSNIRTHVLRQMCSHVFEQMCSRARPRDVYDV